MIQNIIIACLTLTLPPTLIWLYTRQRQIEIKNKQLKISYYKSFFKSVSDLAIKENKTTQAAFSEGCNNLLLVGSCNVIYKLQDFIKYLQKNRNNINQDAHDILLTSLIKEIRNDIFNKKENLPKITLMGGNYK